MKNDTLEMNGKLADAELAFVTGGNEPEIEPGNWAIQQCESAKRALNHVAEEAAGNADAMACVENCRRAADARNKDMFRKYFYQLRAVYPGGIYYELIEPLIREIQR